jgi:hypothetical protein
MTQAYYTTRLLPIYVNEIQSHRIYYGFDCVLQQENDPSHGTRPDDNAAKRFQIDNLIPILLHPPQSTDILIGIQ